MSLIKGARDCLKMEMNNGTFILPSSIGQSRPATTADTCPDMHLHRILGLGFIAWLASLPVAACAPVSFYLHSCKKRSQRYCLASLWSTSVSSPYSLNHLTVFSSFGCRFQIISPPKYGCHQCPQLPSSVAFVAPSMWFHHPSSSGL